MSTESAIRKGKGIVANPEFFLTFFLAGAMGIARVLSVGVSGYWGWGLIGAVAALAVGAYFLGQNLFVMLLALGGLLTGILSAVVVFYLWGIEHEQALWGGLLALILVVLPPGVIFGERILHLFVAFMAGAWGILSILVFINVLIGVE